MKKHFPGQRRSWDLHQGEVTWVSYFWGSGKSRSFSRPIPVSLKRWLPAASSAEPCTEQAELGPSPAQAPRDLSYTLLGLHLLILEMGMMTLPHRTATSWRNVYGGHVPQCLESSPLPREPQEPGREPGPFGRAFAQGSAPHSTEPLF